MADNQGRAREAQQLLSSILPSQSAFKWESGMVKAPMLYVEAEMMIVQIEAARGYYLGSPDDFHQVKRDLDYLCTTVRDVLATLYPDLSIRVYARLVDERCQGSAKS